MGSIGVAVLVIVASVGVWSAVHQGSYDRSHNGCVSVNVVSSTGGAVIHECGARARALCTHAFQHNDQVSRLTRPQCRLADLAPAH